MFVLILCFSLIGAVEGLENCPNVQSLDLSSNSIEEIEGIDCCVNLWNLNIAHNQVNLSNL